MATTNGHGAGSGSAASGSFELRVRRALGAAGGELSTSDVARFSGVARHTAAKYLGILRAKGAAVCRPLGNTKLWRMSADMKPLNHPEQAMHLARLFEDVHSPLTEEAAVAEAERCLQCGGPLEPAPCTAACPASVDVPGFIRDVGEGRAQDAAATIFKANVLGGSCARVCPTEVLCEGACVVGGEGRRPLEIGRLQRYATDRAFEGGHSLRREGAAESPEGKRGRVAVVGAGPAGLACAAELALHGHRVTVYEARPRPGGLVTHAIAPYKQREAPLPQEVDAISALGVEFEYGSRFGVDLPEARLEDTYDAVFLGIGMGADIDTSLPGEHLPGVWESLRFVEALKRGTVIAPNLGRRTAVIGGGNTAIDVAREAVRLGCEDVVVLYRRTETQMPAYPHEVEAARREGVRFMWLTAPTRFYGSGRIEGIECVRMKLGDPDASGRRRPIPEPGSAFTLEADTVIKAIGQRAHDEIFGPLCLQVERGRIVVDEMGRTSRERIFAGGDCVNGGATAVEAVRDGVRAARGIHRLIAGDAETEESTTLGALPKATVQEDGGVTSHEIGAFGISTERKLCKGCELCIHSCPKGLLSLDEKGKIVMSDVSHCIFCGLCEARCPDFAIWLTRDDPVTQQPVGIQL